MVENISVSVFMCVRGLFIISDSIGVVRRMVRFLKVRVWKICFLRVLLRVVWVWVMVNVFGLLLKLGCIVIGFWDRVKLDIIGKIDMYLLFEFFEVFV